MKTAFVYLLVSQLTGSPLLALAAIAVLWLSGGSWYLGRFPDVMAPFRRWSRERALRETLAANPHDMTARSELAGLIAERRPAEAKELLGEVLRRYPEQALSHYFMGLAELGLGNTEGGTREIEAALAIRADLRWGEPMLKLGDHLFEKGRFTEASAAYERATQAHASHAQAWFSAGRAASKAGNGARAREFWQRTLTSTAGAPPFKRRQDRLWRWRAWLALR